MLKLIPYTVLDIRNIIMTSATFGFKKILEPPEFYEFINGFYFFFFR